MSATDNLLSALVFSENVYFFEKMAECLGFDLGEKLFLRCWKMLSIIVKSAIDPGQ